MEESYEYLRVFLNNKLDRKAVEVTGLNQASLELDVQEKVLAKVLHIMDNYSHPTHESLLQ